MGRDALIKCSLTNANLELPCVCREANTDDRAFGDLSHMLGMFPNAGCREASEHEKQR
jgi:hypothetical protein